MERREFIAVGTAAAVVSATQAFAQATGQQDSAAKMEDMHPPLYKNLENASIECVSTGNDCLRHCLGMFAMKDTSMAECADASLQLVAACNALASLAALNSSHIGRAGENGRFDLRGLQEAMRQVSEDRRMRGLRQSVPEMRRRMP